MSNTIHSGGVFRVICRAQKDQKLFRSHGDYEFFLQQLRKEKAAHEFLLYSWCLVPDCVYLLIEVTHPRALERIKHLMVRYARHYGRRYGLRGDLFVGHIELRAVMNDRDIVEVGRDIHLIPKKERLSYEDYAYSSYQSYVKDSGGSGYRCLTDKGRTLRQFSYDPIEYREYLRDEADQGDP